MQALAFEPGRVSECRDALPRSPPAPLDVSGNAPAVLLTDARWRKALSAARALGRAGVRVVTADSTRLVPAAWSRYVTRHVVLPAPATDPEGFVQALLRVAAAERGLVVLPLEDPTLAALSHARTRLDGIALPIPAHAAVETALDKQATGEAARRLGIPVPATVVPEGPEDAARCARALGFPLVVKPRRAWGSQGFRVVERAADLDAVYRGVHARFPRPLLQERIPAG